MLFPFPFEDSVFKGILPMHFWRVCCKLFMFVEEVEFFSAPPARPWVVGKAEIFVSPILLGCSNNISIILCLWCSCFSYDKILSSKLLMNIFS